MGFFDDMVVCSIRWSLNEVLRHRDVHSFQLRYVNPGLGERSGRNFSEKLVVVGVILLEHSERARCSDEVDASCCRVKLDLVSTPNAVERLNYFSCFGIHDDEFPRFILVSAFNTAADKQAM